jgi:hypothetical protein
MLDLEKVAGALTNHVAKCRSAQIVCQAPIAAESWFRVELVLALVDPGVGLEHIKFAYAYPGSRDRGDLAIWEASVQHRPELIAQHAILAAYNLVSHFDPSVLSPFAFALSPQP